MPDDMMVAWTRRREEALAQQAIHRNTFTAQGGVCWHCRDTGYEHGDTETGAPCEACDAGRRERAAWEKRWIERQIALAGVPLRMRGWSFETFPRQRGSSLREARKFAANWDAASGAGILFLGDASVGKTGLLVAAFRATLERWAHALTAPRRQVERAAARGWLITDTALLDALRAGYGDGSAHEVLRRAKTCDLLLLDDFGKADYREGHGWAAERVYEIINARYNDLKPTWLSTNWGAEQLVGRLGEMGEPIMDRIFDANEALLVSGEKLRGTGR